MPHHAMTPVERLRVHAIDVAHQPRQVGLAGTHHQVVVVAHLAIGQHLGIKTIHRQRDDFQLGDPVLIVAVDGLTPVSM